MERQRENEWPWTLNVPSLVADGWYPLPFREFVVKIHSRSPLSSDYSYMYEMVGQSWRTPPLRMAFEVAKQTAMRIGEHVRMHELKSITLIIHGGEPLLAGRELIAHLINETRSAVGSDVTVNAIIQTNAISLDDSYLELFQELGVRVGVSLDRNTQNYGAHRRFLNGRGGDVAISAGLRRLLQPRFRHLFSGLLCTVDLYKNPIETYDALADFEPPRVDFLLPYGTWEAPPPGRLPGVSDSPYADWLIAVFEHWYPAPRVGIRIFDDVMKILLGMISNTEGLGLEPARVVVIEPDGKIAQVDILDTAYHGELATGLNVSTDPLDRALLLPGSVGRQLGAGALCDECKKCPIKRVCGGGLYSHRYRAGTGFANPSVYCPDLTRLIDHIREKMVTDINRRRGNPGAG